MKKMPDVVPDIDEIPFYEYLDKIWHYPLFHVGSNSVLVANIVLGTLMVILGVKYYRKFTAKFRNYIISNFDYDQHTIHTLEKVISYFIVFVYSIFILEISGIPLNAFAFLGGAVALSIGLGAQNLINNFLSGFIVMMEGSVEIGDVVEIDGVIGRVHSIGARATHIHTISMAEVIIPNGNFMQNMFVKINTSQDAVKHKAALTINNDGFEANKLKESIIDVMQAVTHVLNKPAPEMYLVEIKNQQYKYIVYFYTSVAQYNRIEAIQNDINHTLLDKWGKNDISLTYLRESTIKKDKS